MISDLVYTPRTRSVIGVYIHHALRPYTFHEEYPIRKRKYKQVGREIAARLAVLKRNTPNGTLTLEAKVQAIQIALFTHLARPLHINHIYEKVLQLPGFADRVVEITGNFNDVVWKEVEMGRPLNVERYYPHHYLHVSTQDPTQVAYYQSIDHLMQGRETRTKLGRYLTKYFSNSTDSDLPGCGLLDDEAIRERANYFTQIQRPAEVKFARTKDEIIRAIAEGPSDSCMSNAFHGGSRTNYDHWQGHVHPAAVYGASGDFEVGYLEDKDGNVTARVICNREKKLMARCYGDYERLEQAMMRLGYRSECGALVGLRLEKIANRNGDGWIMPYVDAGTRSGGGNLWVNDRGGWWILTNAGGEINTYEGYEHDGVAGAEEEDDGVECDDCGEYVDEDYITYISYNERSVCRHCLNNNYTEAFGRRRFMDWFPSDEVIECLSDNNNYLRAAASNHEVYECEVTGDWYHIDDLVMTNRGYVHCDEAVSLDVEDSDGNIYAVTSDTVQTHDGRTIMRDDSETREDGKVYHVDDPVEECEVVVTDKMEGC